MKSSVHYGTLDKNTEQIGFNISGVVYMVLKSDLLQDILGDTNTFFHKLMETNDIIEKDENGNFIIYYDKEGFRILLHFLSVENKQAHLLDLINNKPNEAVLLQKAANFVCMNCLSYYIEKQLDIKVNKFQMYNETPKSQIIYNIKTSKDIVVLKPFTPYNFLSEHKNEVSFVIVKEILDQYVSFKLYLRFQHNMEEVDFTTSDVITLPKEKYSIIYTSFDFKTSTLNYSIKTTNGDVTTQGKLQYFGINHIMNLCIQFITVSNKFIIRSY